MIRRLLIANRGEIAVRVVRACREQGIESVAVYSTADAGALHVRLADRAVEIGPPAAAESYLRIDRIVDAARKTGADAVHPGYGFLAENAAFAEACAAAGLTFVGPPPEAIRRMGSKIEARAVAEGAGVPAVPGETPGDQSTPGVAAAVRRIGLPALIKASAGGGGKGMRAVAAERDVEDAIEAARREATAAFGDGTLYVERLLERPRHVEFQILADAHGGVVHLFERECSVQRRHQKIVEETPSPALTARLRDAMGAAAVAIGRAVDYRGAGTIEFLLEGEEDSARFYFLEMNTRLQVEHPVTEAVVGVDLVRAQLEVAAGRPVPWPQNALRQRGHAVECRVYAEDPETFLPQAGRLLMYREPAGPGVRVDSGVEEGDEVGVQYDPLLAKLIAVAESRPAAIDRASAALRRYVVLGLRSNVSLLVALLGHPAFRKGVVDTGFVEREIERLKPEPPTGLTIAAAAAVASRNGRPAAPPFPEAGASADRGWDPWDALSEWRS